MLLSNNGGSSKTYVDDVFSSYLYIGNGSTQTINNGIDLAGKGGMVWVKNRASTSNNSIWDTTRGVGTGGTNTKALASNLTNAEGVQGNGLGGDYLSAFTSSGFSVQLDFFDGVTTNDSGVNYVSWTFRKAPKFFDVVTYAGNSTPGRQIAHSLGVAPGMIVIKDLTGSVDPWYVYHRSTGATQYLKLNTTNAAATDATAFWNGTAPTASVFTVASNGTNETGKNYVAYLFAHDTSADGIIQCGSYVGNGSGGQSINIGFEPQFLLIKNSSQTGDWVMFDMLRGMAVTTSNPLRPNTSGAESTGWTAPQPTATGFRLPDNTLNDNANTHIYLAIRRPNKPPTTGTQVFAPVTYTGNGGAGTVIAGFAPDLIFAKSRTSTTRDWFWADRLRGAGVRLSSNTTGGDVSDATNVTAFLNTAVTLGVSAIGNAASETYDDLIFRRAPGFFSSFAYTGTGTNRTTPHDLAAIPDLLIVKSISAATDWQVWCNGLAANEKLVLNSNAGKVTDATALNNTLPTSTNISLGTASSTNANGGTFIAYTFSSLPGIQKIGTYVGDGTSGRVIDCGFTTGARFVCIKAVSTTGSWLVSDTARGITSSADPYLQLNSTAAEITTEDWLDPSSVGFIVNNVASSNANASGVTYMYWAIS